MSENGSNGNLSVTYQDFNYVRLTREGHTNVFYSHAFSLAWNVFESRERKYSGGGWSKCVNVFNIEQDEILNVNNVFYLLLSMSLVVKFSFVILRIAYCIHCIVYQNEQSSKVFPYLETG